MNSIRNLLATMRIQDIIDILLVALLFYWIYTIIRGTRAEQLSKGIVVLIILTRLSEWLQMYTLNYILNGIMTFGFLAVIIVFQPELRRGLEFIGRSSSLSSGLLVESSEEKKTVSEIVNAVGSLSRQKIGALIVIERKTGLSEIVDTGTSIDGNVSSGLLINIFIPNTPLHDGAVIIRRSTILSAASFLPLTDNRSLSKELGTRHRAAIGVSERSDCLSIVVSEETGSISIAENGKLDRHLDLSTLEEILNSIYLPEDGGPWFFRHGKEKKETL